MAGETYRRIWAGSTGDAATELYAALAGLGIGTNTPLAHAHLLGPGVVQFIMESAAASNVNIRLENAAGGGQIWGLRVSGGGDLQWVDQTGGRIVARYEKGAPQFSLYVTAAGLVGVGGTSTPANAQLTIAGTGILSSIEGSVPTATTGYGKTWWQSDNTLRGQDGDGNSHIIHGDAFNELIYGSATVVKATVTIANQNEWTLIDAWNNTGDGDDEGNVTASTANSELTLGSAAAGVYDTEWGLSFDVAGGSQKTLVIAAGVERSSKTTITNVTNANPAVVTTFDNHDLIEGDGVIISGVGTPAAADGSFYVNRTGATTFALYDLAKSAVNTLAQGAYVSGGTIDVELPAGAIRSRAANAGNPGVAFAGVQSRALSAGADLRVYVANTEGTQAVGIYSGSFVAKRIGD